LEPEILIVDEVLAVGDVEFQKRCLGKMGDVASQGRTVLFVSHNMGAVSQLCDRCIALQDGGIRFDGETREAIVIYLKTGNGESNSGLFAADTGRNHEGSGRGRIASVDIVDEKGLMGNHFGIGEPFIVHLQVQLDEPISRISAGLQIESPSGIPLLNLRTDSQGVSFGPYAAGTRVRFTIRVPGLPFYPGTYKVEPWFAELGGKRIDQIRDGIGVVLESKGQFASERMIQSGRGVVLMDCDWSEAILDEQ
jgi:lipopolysaccharide transport system ATP-binding protein